MLNHFDLRSVKMLSNLTDAMLKKMERITFVQRYREGDYIFKEGDYAEYLYAVIEGKIGLEINLNSAVPCRVLDVGPGRLFGISSVVDTDKRTTIAHAKALADSKVFRWKGGDLEKLFYEDYQMGFTFMRSIAKILKRRMECARAQLADSLYNSPYQAASNQTAD